MPSPPIEPLRFFVSYSHKDEPYKDDLVMHLAPLRRSGAIASWDDRQIPIGGEWDHEIKSEMNNADVILLLISANFLNSSYCNDVEVARAMERHHDKVDRAVVVPIILRHCDWTDSPFAKLQALPKNAQPISSFDDQDQAYLYIVNQIKNLIKSRSRKAATPVAPPKQTPPQETPPVSTTASTDKTSFSSILPPPPARISDADRDGLRNLIAQNKIEEALKYMTELAKDKDNTTYNILLQKTAEFSELEKRSMMGILSNSEMSRERSKITHVLLNILNDL